MQRARIIALMAIAAYFAFQFWPSGGGTPLSAATTPTPTADRHAASATPPCTSRILSVTASTGEIRLTVTGTAETLRVSYDGGMRVQATETACSAGYCRVLTPAPPKAVQLDGCPAITLP